MTMTSKSDNQAAKGPRHGLNAEEIEKVQQSARNCAVRLGLDAVVGYLEAANG